MTLCDECRGRGEVNAGITYGDGTVARRVVVNPATLVDGKIWILDPNPLVELWGSAVCGICRGTGIKREAHQ